MTKFTLNTPEYLIIHHSGGSKTNLLLDTSNETFESVNAYHKSLGWICIGYHYFIDKTGKITQGRQDNQNGAHAIGYNQNSIGICLAGNFSLTLPTKAQIDSLTKLLTNKVIKYGIPILNIKPHRKFNQTECYGNKLKDDWASNLVTNYTNYLAKVDLTND